MSRFHRLSRRSIFSLTALVFAFAGLACGSSEAPVKENQKAGEERISRIEKLQKKAGVKGTAPTTGSPAP